MSAMRWAALLGLTVMVGPASAAEWEDATAATIGVTAEWSNKVELSDIDGDGLVDIVFANGGNYASKGGAELNRVFKNMGPDAAFEEITDVLGNMGDSARVVKVADLNADGAMDVVVGTTWQSQSRLYLGLGDGTFVEVTGAHLPSQPLSVGDLEVGDVDGDGDLDLVLADWDAGSPQSNKGGRTRLYLNSGKGGMADVTESQMPDVLVRWSWEMELADVDNDRDLDILVSCKSCSGSHLFLNDGAGNFTDASDQLPQHANNYEFEAMDVTGDGFLDLITINDGPGLRQHLFINDGTGTFSDADASIWANAQNPGFDDNAAVFLDYNNDEKPDFIIGSLAGPDRLFTNTDAGFMMNDEAFTGTTTPGTLGIAVADLNGDGRLDVVQSQGETASPDKVFFGVDIPVDSTAPSVDLEAAAVGPELLTITARVHDFKTPCKPHDFTAVVVKWGDESAEMRWVGGLWWRVEIPIMGGGDMSWSVCGTDAVGNERCSETQTSTVPVEVVDPEPDPGPEMEVPGPEIEEPGPEMEEPGPEMEEPGPEMDPELGTDTTGGATGEEDATAGGDATGEASTGDATDGEDISTVPEAESGTSSSDDGGTSTTDGDDGGCQAGGRGAGSGSAIALLLLAVAFLHRRRFGLASPLFSQ